MMTRSQWIAALIKQCDSPDVEHYQICGYSIPRDYHSNGKSVWIDGGTNLVGLFDAEITDREWLENYKMKLHPNDEWTNVDIDTYGKWIRVFNNSEGHQLVDDAIKDHVVGYLD